MRTRIALVLGGAVAASLTLGGGVALADEGVRPGITRAVAAPAGKAVTVVAAKPGSAQPPAGVTECIAVTSVSHVPGTPKPGVAKAVSARPAPAVSARPAPGRAVRSKAGTGKATACLVQIAPAG
jgi:hypothetical protein